MNGLLHRVCRLSCLVIVGLCLCEFARAQEVTKKDVREDIVALKEDMKALGEKQTQIVEQLKELKQMLQAMSGPPTAHPPSTIPVRGESFKGDKTARIAIIEYSDFECPFCGKFMHETFPQIDSNYIKTGKVKYFYRDLTLPSHHHAIPAARAAHCAGEQDKFWELHEDLFANQTALEEKDISARAQALGVNADKFGQCLSSGRYVDDIRKSTQEAAKMGIVGTPTFVIGSIDSDGVVTVSKTIEGAYPYDLFKSDIDDLLAVSKKD
jgi:protein-disulfide isomerase